MKRWRPPVKAGRYGAVGSLLKIFFFIFVVAIIIDILYIKAFYSNERKSTSCLLVKTKNML